jgi:hypothetical protein
MSQKITIDCKCPFCALIRVLVLAIEARKFKAGKKL